MHASIVLRGDPVLFGELFAELVDAFMERALFADAIPICTALLDADQVSPTCPDVRIPSYNARCRSPSRLRCKQVYATSDLAGSKRLGASFNGVRTV